MKERGILMSAPMVRATLAGTKTQTRRALRDGTWLDKNHGVIRMAPAGFGCTGFSPVPCAYGKPGDRLWIRESWAAPHACDHLKPREVPPGTRLHYVADAPLGGLLGRPSIFMPRWASRLTLEVTEVRVERLQHISEADAIAEGIEPHSEPDCWRDYGDQTGLCMRPTISYRTLWDSINGYGSWTTNPQVWVIVFRRI